MFFIGNELSHPNAYEEGNTEELAKAANEKAPENPERQQFVRGYNQCLCQVINYLAKEEGMFAEDSFSTRLVSHLKEHIERLQRGKI